jgi:hypothetical protein
MKRTVSDADFISAWEACGGSPTRVSKLIGLAVRNVHQRRSDLLGRGIPLHTGDGRRVENRLSEVKPVKHIEFERRRQFKVKDGSVVFFTDPHWLPDHSPAAHDALERVIQKIKPVGVICGGDAADGDTISRYDPTRGHHKRFTVREEMDCVKEHFDSIDKVMDRYCPKAWRAWILGNHDVRLSRYIATRAPELKEMPYSRVEDWVPRWPLSWTVEINASTPGMTVLRHRNLAGSLQLQASKAGVHYVHGHLHRLNVHTNATFAGPRYSVDGGSLADPKSEGFDYAEGAAEQVQGFVVLTYVGGELLMPELAFMHKELVYFRGQPV